MLLEALNESPLLEAQSLLPKTTDFIRSLTYDLQLRHKSYQRVDRQTICSTPPESSTSDHSCATTLQSKFRQNLPRASCATRVPSILLLLPLLESSFSNLQLGKELASLDLPRTLTHHLRFQRVDPRPSRALHTDGLPVDVIFDVITTMSSAYVSATPSLTSSAYINTHQALTSPVTFDCLG